MELYVKVKFTAPKYADSLGLIGYDSNIVAKQESFAMNDFEHQSYALGILNEELRDAVKRVNDRLLAEGFGKESFRKPLMGLDIDGNPIDLNAP